MWTALLWTLRGASAWSCICPDRQSPFSRPLWSVSVGAQSLLWKQRGQPRPWEPPHGSSSAAHTEAFQSPPRPRIGPFFTPGFFQVSLTSHILTLDMSQLDCRNVLTSPAFMQHSQRACDTSAAVSSAAFKAHSSVASLSLSLLWPVLSNV